MASRHISLVAALVVLILVLGWLGWRSASPPSVDRTRTTAEQPNVVERPDVVPAVPLRTDDVSDSDRVRVTFHPAGPESAFAGDPDAERPAYPWALSRGMIDALERLQKPVSLSFTDARLADILAQMQDLLGLTITLVPCKVAEKTITFQMKEISAENCLRLLTRQYGLTFAVTPEGQVLVGPEDQVPAAEELRVHQQLRWAREHAGDEAVIEVERAETKGWEALRAQTINLPGVEGNQADGAQLLSERAGVNIIIDRTEDSELPGQPVRLAPSAADGTDVEAVLLELARQTGSGLVHEDGVVRILPVESEDLLRERRQARMAAVRDVLDRQIALERAAVPAWQLLRQVQEQAGLPVYCPEALWLRTEPVIVPTGACSLEQVLQKLQQDNGLQWRLRDGVLVIF